MSKIKCITFDKEAQSKIPKDIREKMNRDRDRAKAMEVRIHENLSLKNLPNEIWKDIPNYEGVYKVSNLGRVKSLERVVKNRHSTRLVKESLLKNCKCISGYLIVSLNKFGEHKPYGTHQLVAMAFLNYVLCGHKMVVNHINFNRLDNRLENLEVVTQRENSNQKHLKSTSKYVGVCWSKCMNKWLSQIVINKKKLFLGYFNNELEAKKYYDKAVYCYNKGLPIKTKPVNFTSKYKGVYFNNPTKKWKAQIYINGKSKHLGTFTNEYNAHLAYQKELKEYEYFKQILDDIKNSGLCELSINFDYGNDMIGHLEKTRLAQYEFTVTYEISIKNHVESSYFNPEEFDCDFTIKNVSELIIYDRKNKILDITDEENEQILMIIKSKLL